RPEGLAETRGEPLLGLPDRGSTASRVVLHLVGPDPADGEVLRLRVMEVEPADRSGGHHRVGLRERDPGALRVEQLEELRLLAVIGARRIAERRADTAEILLQDVLVGEVLVRGVPLAPRAPVEPFLERL